jgi:hypothetical protein
MLNASPKDLPSREKARVGFLVNSSNLRRQPIICYLLAPGGTPYSRVFSSPPSNHLSLPSLACHP